MGAPISDLLGAVYTSCGANPRVWDAQIPCENYASTAYTVPHTLWPGASNNIAGQAIYPWTNTASITHVVSTSTSDTGPVAVVGLDANGRWSETTLPAMTGQTPAALPVPLRAINPSLYAGNPTNAGTIYFMAGTNVTAGVPNNDADVFGIVLPGHGWTHQCVFTVPFNCRASLKGGWAKLFESLPSSRVELQWGGAAYNPTFDVYTDIFNFGNAVLNETQPRQDTPYKPDVSLRGGSRVNIQINGTSSNNVIVTGHVGLQIVEITK